MSPAGHYRSRRRFQRLSIVVAVIGLISYVSGRALGSSFNLPVELLWRLTGIALVPWQIAAMDLIELVVLLSLCWVIPAVAFRWFIRPHCPQCAARMNLLTESGIQYVCRGCGHCHDTGTMQSLAESEGNRIDARPRAEEPASAAPKS